MAKNETYQTLKNVTSNFNKDLECPICMDVVQIPFKMCSRGHLMCVGCLGTLKACPTCQGELFVESPVCIKNLLEHLPHHCQHAANGCKSIVEKGDSHEKFCRFRQVNCRTCGEDVIVKKLVNHFKMSHSNSWIFTSQIVERLQYSNFNLVNKYSFYNLVDMFGHFFWFNVNYGDKKELLDVTFEAIPLGKLENDYYVNVSFINGNFNSILTLKAFIPEEMGQSSHDGSDRMNNDCMSVPKALLSRFIDEDGDLIVSKLFFFKGY